MRIQIVNRTGKPHDTYVYNAETGQMLECIAEIGPMKPSELTDVTLHVFFARLDLYSEYVKVVTECPHCGKQIALQEK